MGDVANRTDGAIGDDPTRLTLVGEDDRCKKEADWDEKEAEDEAKA